MSKVIFTYGLPGSGKSTWAKEYCQKNTDWIRVSRDDLRQMRGKYWLPKQEALISQFEKSCIISSLHRGYNVVVDATNLNPGHLQTLKDEILKHHPETIMECKHFDVSPEECIKRDLARPNSVGAEVIMGMYKRFLAPKIDTVKQSPDWQKAIIVDLDGTVALHVARTPYEESKCETDALNVPVAKIVSHYLYETPYQIIFMSGRQDSCKEQSLNWLAKQGLWVTGKCSLYMRKAGDTRKDAIVKRELFDSNVRGKFFIEFILDDRNQVVEMWRKIGLTCLQVADGAF